MILRYSYHSEHHAEPRDRWVHFLLFLGAFILLLAAGQQLFLYFTDWHAADDEHSWWHLGFGLGYLLAGGALAYVGYRHECASRGPADRYVRVSDDDLTWSLTQKLDEQKIPLADIASVERLNVRDLQVTLKDGSTVIIPIFLVTNEAKQEELMAVLNAV
ncbi:hypothetical protein [Neolewinella persica]|uniref:hypothetical protein n=1 Tax=Neolewinella persica TaxID=70998 RepID=UPI00037660F8|nr:hypothetical protein [Neolewinella persica]